MLYRFGQVLCWIAYTLSALLLFLAIIIHDQGFLIFSAITSVIVLFLGRALRYIFSGY